MGWPVSSMTKLVMSTMLLMGRIPRRPQGCLHPFRGGGDPQVLHHPAEVAGTEVVILYRDADVFPDVSALGAVGRDRGMKIGAQGHRDLPGDTQDALAVGGGWR